LQRAASSSGWLGWNFCSMMTQQGQNMKYVLIRINSLAGPLLQHVPCQRFHCIAFVVVPWLLPKSFLPNHEQNNACLSL